MKQTNLFKERKKESISHFNKTQRGSTIKSKVETEKDKDKDYLINSKITIHYISLMKELRP